MKKDIIKSQNNERRNGMGFFYDPLFDFDGDGKLNFMEEMAQYDFIVRSIDEKESDRGKKVVSDGDAADDTDDTDDIYGEYGFGDDDTDDDDFDDDDDGFDF